MYVCVCVCVSYNVDITELLSHTDIDDAWDRAIGGVCDSVCAVCCLYPCSKRKQPELSTPNFVHIYSMAVAQHALTWRLKAKGHAVTKTVMVAWLLAQNVLLLLAWDCTSMTA